MHHLFAHNGYDTLVKGDDTLSTLSLSHAVGKNCFGASAADVKAVQYALADHKVKTRFGLKPFYAGKIDGIARKDTVAAIDCFQLANKIRVDGKVQTTGPTIRALGTGLSMKAKQQIAAAQLGEKRTGQPTPEQRKAEQAGRKSADTAKIQTPFPKAEADGLAVLIQKMAVRSFVLIVDEANITRDGRFMVSLKLDASTLPKNVPLSTAKGMAQGKLKEEAQASLTWTMPNPNTLTLTSRTAYDFLRDLREPSEEFLKRYNLNKSSIDLVRLKLLAAAEQVEIQGLGQ